jgi:hypothetical protein
MFREATRNKVSINPVNPRRLRTETGQCTDRFRQSGKSSLRAAPVVYEKSPLSTIFVIHHAYKGSEDSSVNELKPEGFNQSAGIILVPGFQRQ